MVYGIKPRAASTAAVIIVGGCSWTAAQPGGCPTRVTVIVREPSTKVCSDSDKSVRSKSRGSTPIASVAAVAVDDPVRARDAGDDWDLVDELLVRRGHGCGASGDRETDDRERCASGDAVAPRLATRQWSALRSSCTEA